MLNSYIEVSLTLDLSFKVFQPFLPGLLTKQVKYKRNLITKKASVHDTLIHENIVIPFTLNKPSATFQEQKTTTILFYFLK